MLEYTTCRHCGATGVEPNRVRVCTQCDGQGTVATGSPNPTGPGFKRLMAAAKAQSRGKGPAMMILWEKVHGDKAAEGVVADLTAAQDYRNRKQRKAYDALCRRAVRLGILVPAK